MLDHNDRHHARRKKNPQVPHDLDDYLNRVLWAKRIGRSPRTKRLYAMTLDRVSEFLGEHEGRPRRPTLDDLNDDTLTAYLAWRLERVAPHTVDKERDQLVALSDFAARKRHIEEFVELPPINPPEIVPECWQREHVVMLLDACRRTTGFINRIPAGEWWEAFHYWELLVGERTEATLSVRWEWLRGSSLIVPADVRKGRKKPMHYRLPAVLVDRLERFRRHVIHAHGKTEGEVFATHWKGGGAKTGSFYRHYGKLLKRAGLPSGRRFKPQCLRRTFASYLKAAGGDPTKALGHSDPRIATRSYLDVTVTEAATIPHGELVARALDLN